MEQRLITLGNQVVAYEVRKSVRARRLRLTVNVHGQVTVTLPARLPDRAAERLLREKSTWVRSKIAFFASLERPVKLESSPAEYRRYRESTLRLVKRLIQRHQSALGVECTAVTIRRQRQRWGSCSRTGRLHFNYKLIFLPEALSEYVVVHELAHLRHFNHSAAFWQAVAAVLPDAASRRRELKRWVVL